MNDFLIQWNHIGNKPQFELIKRWYVVPYGIDEWNKWWIGWNKHCFTWKINGFVKVSS